MITNPRHRKLGMTVCRRALAVEFADDGQFRHERQLLELVSV